MNNKFQPRHYSVLYIASYKILVTLSSITALLTILLYSPLANAGTPLGNVGSYSKWTKVEIILPGPASIGTGDPNPFAIDVDVTFTSPEGRTFTVPGFYDGDGNGNLNGDVWKVRFSADEVGIWNFSTQSSDSTLNGYTGSFSISTANNDAPDFYRWGRLEYTGTAGSDIRYMKFRDGPYWLKAGSDDPENFLGNFTNYDTLSDRKAAIDYLASKGINSQYLITHNIDGDGNDVWPWLGFTISEAKSNGGAGARFDIVKLEEWRELFEYMQSKGVAVYMVLEDDQAWTGYDHERYYRELVARFGYLPALLFNIGEEANENYSLSQSLTLAQQLKDSDPFDHPVGIHNVPLWPDTSPSDTYLDASTVDFTSLQTKGIDPLIHNQITVDWIEGAQSRNRRVPMVGFDEARPILDRKAWWSAYLGGGVWEAHIDKPYDRPMSAWQTVWEQLGGTRTFMETLPFWEMNPDNSLITSGTAYVLAKPGEVYALYLPNGGTVTVNLSAGANYTYEWWNPANDQFGGFQNAGTTSGGQQSFTAPGTGDWALRISKVQARTGPIGVSQVATGAYPDIAVDADGNIHLVYARGGRLRYKKYNAASSSWSSEQDTGIDQHASYRNDPDIALDSNGRPHVVGGQGNGTGQYAYWNGNQWQTIDVPLDRDTALAIDSLDNVYIVERGGNNGGYIGLVRRDAGNASFTIMPDPDVANGLPLGRNDHVYGHIFISPADDSIHVVYRHGAPQNTGYRSSSDGGTSWSGGGISDDDFEAPSGIAASDGVLYVATGNGTVYTRTSLADPWTSLGRIINAQSRHLPDLAVDEDGNVYLASFGGNYDILTANSWIGQQSVPNLTGSSVGFTGLECHNNDCFAVWEEGDNVTPENDNLHDNFAIVIAPVTPTGIGNTNMDTLPPAAPSNLSAE